MKTKLQSESGIALLLECLILMAVMMILAGLSVPSFMQMQRDQNQNTAVARVHQLVNIQTNFAVCLVEYGATDTRCARLLAMLPTPNTPTATDTGGYSYQYVLVTPPPPPTSGECLVEVGPYPVSDGYAFGVPFCSEDLAAGLISSVPTVVYNANQQLVSYSNTAQCTLNEATFATPDGNYAMGFACQFAPTTNVAPTWQMIATPANTGLNNGVTVTGTESGVITCSAASSYAC